MHPQLHHDRENFSHLLTETLHAATTFLSGPAASPGIYVADREKKQLPHTGHGARTVLDTFLKEYAPFISGSAGSRYFGLVTGGSTPASVIGDWLVSVYDQNACGSNDSIAPVLERETIALFRQLFQLDEAFTGTFVTGATMSNFCGLALGRQWVGEQHGRDISQEGIGQVPIYIVSATPHSSVVKSLSMLGIGRNAVVRPAALPDREAVDINALEETLQQLNAPVIVVANSGTVNTVDFDDLEAIGKLKSKYLFWLHVDAAFGGFAAVSPKFAHFMNGINHADSITIDAHKWLNVPYDAAMQFTRHKKLQLKVFQNSAAYLGDPEKSADFFHYGPENSRRWRALPSWFTLMAYGSEGYRDIVERNCAAAEALGKEINQSNDFRLLAPVRMNVVCFSFREETTSSEIQDFLNLVRDDGRAYFTPTLYHRTPGIRAAISNWQTDVADVEVGFRALTEVRLKMKSSR